MKISLENAFDWNDYPKINELPLNEYLTRIFIQLVHGSQAFPGLTRAHFFAAFAKGEYDSFSIKKINQFFEDIAQQIKGKYPDRDETELRTALMQIASAAFVIPSILPKLFDPFNPVDYTDEGQLREYIKRIVDRIL